MVRLRVATVMRSHSLSSRARRSNASEAARTTDRKGKPNGRKGSHRSTEVTTRKPMPVREEPLFFQGLS